MSKPDTTQAELREQLLAMAVMVCHRDEPERINGTFNFIDIEALITAHTNKQIAEVLDRLYGELMEEGETIVHQWQVEGAIAAERAKLKEVEMSDIKKPTQNVSGVGAITPLYQSELKQQIGKIVHRAKTDKFRPLAASVATSYIMELITANYTPNSEVQDLVATSMADAADEASKNAINQLTMGGEWIPASEVAERERVARLNERQELALDLYHGHTFSNSTDFRVKFNKFIKNNNRRIDELTKDQL